jgi:WD40 repeat protein
MCNYVNANVLKLIFLSIKLFKFKGVFDIANRSLYEIILRIHNSDSLYNSLVSTKAISTDKNIYSITMLKDSYLIILYWSSSKFEIWDIRIRLCIKTIETGSHLSSVIILPDSNFATLSTNSINIWKTEENFISLKVINPKKAYFFNEVILLSNTYLVCGMEKQTCCCSGFCCFDSKPYYICIYDCETFSLTKMFNETHNKLLVSLSNDMFASSCLWDDNNTIKIWKITKRKSLFSNSTYCENVKKLFEQERIIRLSFAHKVNMLISVSHTETKISFWKMSNYQYIKQCKVTFHIKCSLVMPHDFIAFGGSGYIYIYDLKNDQWLKELKRIDRKNAIYSLALLKDYRIISGHLDGTIEFWDY